MKTKLMMSEADYAWAKEQADKSGHDWQPMTYMELNYCKRCMACEGGTPTQCPGKPMSGETMNRVYQGEIDYRDGQWVNQPATAMGHIYGIHREPLQVVSIED